MQSPSNEALRKDAYSRPRLAESSSTRVRYVNTTQQVYETLTKGSLIQIACDLLCRLARRGPSRTMGKQPLQQQQQQQPKQQQQKQHQQVQRQQQQPQRQLKPKRIKEPKHADKEPMTSDDSRSSQSKPHRRRYPGRFRKCMYTFCGSDR